MDVCLKCGDKGDKKRLIHCNKCRVAGEHSYCFDILPTKGVKKVVWTCEECNPIEAKPIREPSIRSARISHANAKKLNRIEMLKQKGVSTAFKISNSVQKKGDSQPVGNPSENAGNEQSLKRNRRITIDDSSSDEEPKSICCVDKPVLAHPAVEPSWRGYLRLRSRNTYSVIGVVGHLSTKSGAKLKNVIKEVPMMLDASILPRADIWPWKHEPTDDCIAIYLFPEHERDEKDFDELMNEMIMHDQALKVVTESLQLFVFHSCNLTPEHWRFCKKYYLWGVFKST